MRIDIPEKLAKRVRAMAEAQYLRPTPLILQILAKAADAYDEAHKPKEKAKPGPKPQPKRAMTGEEIWEEQQHRKAVSEGTLIFLKEKLDAGMDAEEILQRYPDHYAALLPEHHDELFG